MSDKTRLKQLLTIAEYNVKKFGHLLDEEELAAAKASIAEAKEILGEKPDDIDNN